MAVKKVIDMSLIDMDMAMDVDVDVAMEAMLSEVADAMEVVVVMVISMMSVLGEENKNGCECWVCEKVFGSCNDGIGEDGRYGNPTYIYYSLRETEVRLRGRE